MSFFYHINGESSCFIHIPKTGGKSIAKALAPYNKYGHLEWKRPSRKYVGHHTLNETIEIGLPDSADYIFFTCIRNPWDRLVSFYHYIKKDPQGSGLKWVGEEILLGKMVFRDFIFLVTRGDIKVLRSQGDYLKTNLKIDPVVLKQETLGKDLAEFLRGLDGNIKIKIPHINKSSHLHYKEYFTDNEIIREVERYEEYVIKKYNYQFK